MCGRYVARRDVDDLVAEFEAEKAVWEPLTADYNVAPTDPVPVVLTRHRRGDRGGPVVRQLRVARWGLVPSWAPDSRRAAKLINARAETAGEMPAFRCALARRRCLVPADGWYEWAPREDGAGRQPTYLTPLPARPLEDARAGDSGGAASVADGSGLAFAGLYEVWGEARLLTSAIVTTAAVGELVRVHSRMPLVLPRRAWSAWLDPDRTDVADLLLPPDPALVAALELRPVGPEVGNVANDGPGLIERATAGVPTLY